MLSCRRTAGRGVMRGCGHSPCPRGLGGCWLQCGESPERPALPVPTWAPWRAARGAPTAQSWGQEPEEQDLERAYGPRPQPQAPPTRGCIPVGDTQGPCWVPGQGLGASVPSPSSYGVFLLTPGKSTGLQSFIVQMTGTLSIQLPSSGSLSTSGTPRALHP